MHTHTHTLSLIPAPPLSRASAVEHRHTAAMVKTLNKRPAVNYKEINVIVKYSTIHNYMSSAAI